MKEGIKKERKKKERKKERKEEKRPGSEAGHSSSAEVNNGGAIARTISVTILPSFSWSYNISSSVWLVIINFLGQSLKVHS
jgi:hypothetical protein